MVVTRFAKARKGRVMDRNKPPPVFVWPDPQRWIASVVKARTEGITLSPIPRFKTLMIATSGTTAGQSYFVDEKQCTCLAGVTGGLCKHRSLYIYEHFDRLVETHGLPHWEVLLSAAG